MDKSDSGQFDLIRNTNSFFEPRQGFPFILKRVKLFLNKIIKQTEKNFPQWKTLMKQTFTVKSGSEKKVLKNLVGMKFKQNTPLFSQAEIDDLNLNFDVKAPQIMRVIIKWTEELEKRAKGLTDGSLLQNPFAIWNTDKINFLNWKMKQQISQFLQNKTEEALEKTKGIFRQSIQSILSSFPDYFEGMCPYLSYLNFEQSKVGLLSSVLSQAASNNCIMYVLILISLLGETSRQALGTVQDTRVPREQVFSDKRGNTFKSNLQYHNFQFVSFTISDLLRSKCTGSLSEIKQVYQNICNNPNFTVFRVKNRIDTSNRDFLVNVRLNGTPLLCQIQLAISGASEDKKQSYFDHFNHFLFQLSRAMYGPLAESAIICTHLTDYVPYFQKQLKKIPEIKRTFNKPFSLVGTTSQFTKTKLHEVHVQGYKVSEYVLRAFICGICLKFGTSNRHKIPAIFLTPGAPTQDNTKAICGVCQFMALSSDDKVKIIFQNSISVLHHFIEAASPKQTPNVVFAVLKSNRDHCVNILMKVKRPKQTLYLSMFYNYNPHQQKLTPKKLHEDYFVFKPKESALVVQADRQKLVSMRTNSKKLFQIKQIIHPDSKVSAQLLQKKCFIANISSDTDITFDHVQYDDSQFVQVMFLPNADNQALIVLHDCPSEDKLQDIITQRREITEGQTLSLNSLKKWQLQKCNLGNDSFKSLPQCGTVEQIELSHNYLSSLQFIKSVSLKKLELVNNRIESLSLDEDTFPSLEVLDVSHNFINSVDLRHLNLRKLNLNGNKLKTLNEAGWKVPSLRELSLKSNKIFSIQADCFQDIERLQIEGNEIEEFSATKLSKLEFLNLSSNKLTKLQLPNKLPKLRELILFGNKLQVLDLEKTEAPLLQTINCNCNYIREFKLSSNCTESINYINLRTNRLAKFDISNIKVSNLEYIDIQCNIITQIVLPTTKFPNLLRVAAYYNPINPIQTNVPIVPGGQNFPLLYEYLQGARWLHLTVFWRLSLKDKPQRQQIYRKATQANEGFFSGAIEDSIYKRYFDQQSFDSDQNIVKLAKVLLQIEDIPKIYIERTKEMLGT